MQLTAIVFSISSSGHSKIFLPVTMPALLICEWINQRLILFSWFGKDENLSWKQALLLQDIGSNNEKGCFCFFKSGCFWKEKRKHCDENKHFFFRIEEVREIMKFERECRRVLRPSSPARPWRRYPCGRRDRRYRPTPTIAFLYFPFFSACKSYRIHVILVDHYTVNVHLSSLSWNNWLTDEIRRYHDLFKIREHNPLGVRMRNPSVHYTRSRGIYIPIGLSRARDNKKKLTLAPLPSSSFFVSALPASFTSHSTMSQPCLANWENWSLIFDLSGN